MAEEDYTLLGMATLDPKDLVAAGIALEVFLDEPTDYLFKVLRSTLGFCDCGSVRCGLAKAERAANGREDEPMLTHDDIELMKLAVNRISEWITSVLMDLKEQG